MKPSPISHGAALPTLLLLTGGVAVLVGFLADVLGISAGHGLGTPQLLLAAGGFAMIGFGLFAEPALRQRVSTALARKCGPYECLAVTAVIGLLNGGVELAHHAIRAATRGVVLRQPEEVLWLGPACYLVWHLVLGLIWAAVAMIRPRWASLPAVAFSSLLVVVWTQLRLYGSLDQGSVWFLSLCAAFAIARSLAPRSNAVVVACRWAAPLLIVALALGAVGQMAWANRAPTPPAEGGRAAPGAKNVLLIVLDTVRADHMSSYGYHRTTTPNLDGVAERGVLFERAYSTSPWTLPSHSSMFTGRYHHELSVNWRKPLDDTWPTIAEEFGARGYATGGFVGNLRYCLGVQGLARGFHRYEDFQITPGITLFCTSLGDAIARMTGLAQYQAVTRNDATVVTDLFLSWLDDVEDQPFFAFLNYFDAHEPYAPPPEYEGHFAPMAEWVPHWNHRASNWSEEEIQGFIDAYDACLAYLDSQAGRVFDALAQRGLLDNTLVIIAGDHGEHFKENDLMGHGNSLYRPNLHVPFSFTLPGVLPATRYEREVTQRDMAATLFDCLDNTGDRWPGASLIAALRGDAVEPSPVLCELTAGINVASFEPHSRGPLHALFEGPLHYIHNGDGIEELYDLDADPLEEHDLADDPAHAAALDRLRRRATEILAK